MDKGPPFLSLDCCTAFEVTDRAVVDVAVGPEVVASGAEVDVVDVGVPPTTAPPTTTRC